VNNTLFYTFSTIAQTLAGGVAFLGAFVLFRFQGIASELRENASLLCQKWPNDDLLQRAAANSDFDAFIARANVLVAAPIPGGWKAHQQACLDSISLLWCRRAQMLRSLSRTLIGVGLVTSLAIGVLSTVEWIAPFTAIAKAVLVAGVLAFVASIYFLGALVFEVVRGTKSA
jgi:hypothetical protein